MNKGDFLFLAGGGETGDLVRTHDWAATSLGPIETWPQSLRTAVSIVLLSPVPIVMLWGEDGVMIYNDAYSEFAGRRHPALFGAKVREGWPEVADFNDNVMKVGLAGGTLAYKDQELTLHRQGRPEQVWMNLDYSPVVDESGKPAGVIAIVVETTQRVLADRQVKAEHERLRRMFEQAPSFMAILRGPDHVFETINPAYRRLIGGRDVVGKPVAEALPEIVEQGFAALLDRVRASGEAFSGQAVGVRLRRTEGAEEEQRFLDFVYQPLRDESGAVTQIFVEGYDVTERVQGERRQKLLMNELNHRVKNSLATVQAVIAQTLRGASTVEDAGRVLNARIKALSRAQDVLTREQWDGADMETVVRSALEVHAAESGRIDIAGPHLRLGPRAALALSLALHELATNAAKYGALSVEGGSVSVRWSVAPGGDTVRFEWREQGGPEVTPPTRRGFGTQLIKSGLEMEFAARVEMDYRPDGLVAGFSASRAALADESGDA